MNITALVGSLVTVIPVVTASMILIIREIRSTKAEVRDVHRIVNSERTAMVAHVDQLEQTLNDAGIPVPPAPPREEIQP